MEIKWKIQTLNALIDKIEKEIDLTTLIIQFDSYYFLMKNRGIAENKFINKHRSNKEKIKLISSDIHQFNRQVKKILQLFQLEDEKNAKKLQETTDHQKQ